MNLIESIKVAISSLWANKMRSFLTMLGIIIGISSVITIVALGQGSKAEISSEFEKFGTNRVYFGMNWSENPKYRDRYDDTDISTIKRAFDDELVGISPIYRINGDAIKGRDTGAVYLMGVNEEYDEIDNFIIKDGRFLAEHDIKGRRDVCIINKELAEKLFKRTNVVGEKILFDTGYSNFTITVIGIYDTPESTFEKFDQQFGERPTTVFLPITTLKKLGYSRRYYSLEANIRDGSKVDSISEKIISLVERRHRNSGENYYRYESSKKQMRMLDNILSILSKVVGAIAAISLLVGGIGVMNIMLVSVTERTREIGIRKAIGAQRRDILIQFLVEAMIISGTGGILGTLLGLTIANIAAFLLGFPPTFSVITAIIAVSFSAVVGIFFGIYPANKASKLDPIDALRYE